MQTSRATLLLAAALLVAAELVSLTLLLRGIGEHQTQRTQTAIADAAALMPRIAEWARARAGKPGEELAEPWVKPFDRLIVRPSLPALDESGQRRLEGGELVVVSQVSDQRLSVFGWIHGPSGRILIQLSQTAADSRLAPERTVIAQHALILLAALSGLVLVVLYREAPQESGLPALRAYEEAMSRLRVRDDERLAAFDREKHALTSILRDRETMARAGELTAGIVHEVRNSMGAIAAQARLIEKTDDDRARRPALAITEEVRTLQSVMDRFLDFIRTEKVQDGDFDLSRLVERVATRERGHHGARIEVEGAPTQVRGDEDLLERAIENVIRNAGQASSEGGRVSVKFGADATHAFVIVEDSGPGIADVEKALRPFESDRAGGLGLGLPLVLKILALHQGSLELGPRGSGRGTLAVCRWPKLRPAATSSNGSSGAINLPKGP